MKFNILAVSILLATASARADEVVQGGQTQDCNSGRVLSVDECVLSVQHLYKRVTAGTDEMRVISLADALIDPGCPKLRDYTEVAKAYANHEQAPKVEQHVAKSGAIFTRDTSNPKLGEAYRDQPGLVWSGIISDSMNQSDAEKACAQLGARLPTREEFRQLATTLGRDSAQGYQPLHG